MAVGPQTHSMSRLLPQAGMGKDLPHGYISDAALALSSSVLALPPEFFKCLPLFLP